MAYPKMNYSDQSDSQHRNGGCLWPGIGMILGGLFLVLFILFISWTRMSRVETSSESEVIVLAPATSTVEIFPTMSEQPSGQLNPTDSPENLLGADLTIGDIVEVYGTSGQGLSLRIEPGLSSVVGGYGLDSEILEIRGGPIQTDGYIWWFLVSPYDNSKNGWAVGAFLRKISP